MLHTFVLLHNLPCDSIYSVIWYSMLWTDFYSFRKDKTLYTYPYRNVSFSIAHIIFLGACNIGVIFSWPLTDFRHYCFVVHISNNTRLALSIVQSVQGNVKVYTNRTERRELYWIRVSNNNVQSDQCYCSGHDGC